MDVLRPPTVWVQGRCYRVNSTINNTTETNYSEADLYEAEDQAYKDEVDCAQEHVSEIDIQQLDGGKFIAKFHVASMFFAYIIGGKGATKKRVETETYTQIRIPSRGQSGDVYVTGRDQRSVRQACMRLEIIVAQARKKQPFTHFLSIPLNNGIFQENFLRFKSEVLEKCGTNRGVDESIFQDPAKLHLTLCVFVLADESERLKAVETLKLCQEEIVVPLLDEQRLKVEIQGVEYMNDDPGEVHVLYGRTSACSWSHSLQTLADDVVDFFVKAGVAERQYKRVKLHVTLMNTKFRADLGGVTNDLNNGKNLNRESFCARQILEEFEDFNFGEVEVESIDISVRHSKAENGFYSCSGRIKF